MFTENPQSTNLKDRESVNTPRALEVFSQLLLRYNTLSDQQQQVIDGIITQLDFLQRTILGKQSEPEESAEQIEIRSEEKETLSAGIDPDEVYAQMRDFEVIATQEQRRKLSRMFFNLGYWSHIRYGASSSHDIIQDLEEISDDSPEINRQKQLILQYIQDYINAVKNEADLPSIDYEMLENGGVEILHDLSEESREKVMKVLEDINELTAHLFQVDNVNFTVRGNNLIQTPGVYDLSFRPSSAFKSAFPNDYDDQADVIERRNLNKSLTIVLDGSTAHLNGHNIGVDFYDRPTSFGIKIIFKDSDSAKRFLQVINEVKVADRNSFLMTLLEGAVKRCNQDIYDLGMYFSKQLIREVIVEVI